MKKGLEAREEYIRINHRAERSVKKALPIKPRYTKINLGFLKVKVIFKDRKVKANSRFAKHISL